MFDTKYLDVKGVIRKGEWQLNPKTGFVDVKGNVDLSSLGIFSFFRSGI